MNIPNRVAITTKGKYENPYTLVNVKRCTRRPRSRESAESGAVGTAVCARARAPRESGTLTSRRPNSAGARKRGERFGAIIRVRAGSAGN